MTCNMDRISWIGSHWRINIHILKTPSIFKDYTRGAYIWRHTMCLLVQIEIEGKGINTIDRLIYGHIDYNMVTEQKISNSFMVQRANTKSLTNRRWDLAYALSFFLEFSIHNWAGKTTPKFRGSQVDNAQITSPPQIPLNAGCLRVARIPSLQGHFQGQLYTINHWATGFPMLEKL